MKTFETYPGGKAAAVAEAKLHRDQDRLITGTYYQNGTENWKGCSIGCFVKTKETPHEMWAEMMGTPVWLPKLIDIIFESLPEEERIDWHVDVIESIPEGVDVSWVGPAHAARCLRRCIEYVGEGDEDRRVRCRDVVADSADILAGGRWLTETEAAEAAKAARAARAAGAAWAARAAEAARTAEAAEAAGAAWAAWAAGTARAAGAAGAAWGDEIRAQRDDLLELLRKAGGASR